MIGTVPATDATSLVGRGRNRLVGTLRRSPTAAAGGSIILLFASLALLAPFLMPHDPVQAFPAAVLTPPSATFLFGTDGNGMDVFSRVIFGARFAFGIAVPAVIIALLVGVPLGLWTGYVGGWADEVVMRGFDALRIFPSIILALAVVAAAGPVAPQRRAGDRLFSTARSSPASYGPRF